MNISILGCGWLGFPLAKYLMDEGYLVITTNHYGFTSNFTLWTWKQKERRC